MHIDPILLPIVGSLLGIVLIGIILHKLKVPQVIGYLLAGVALGPAGIGLFTDVTLLEHLGSLGVVLLMFFIGMEVSPKRLAKIWKIAVLGTLLQISISVFVVVVLGRYLGWDLGRSILLGFIISLSSTAVVLKLLNDWGELNSEVGQDVLGVLLVQDLAVIPMLLIIGVLGPATAFNFKDLGLQVVGGMVIIGLVVYVVKQENFSIPFLAKIRENSEIQVFLALVICFGLALLTGLMGLSTAMGAFAAGMILSSARETEWIFYSLEPFRVVFVALFFVSIGMLFKPDFISANLLETTFLVVFVLFTNTFINAFIFKVLGQSWQESLYAGALLAQIGEFSFILAAIGVQTGIISSFGYQMTISVIALSLLLSPGWIGITRQSLKWFDKVKQ